MSRLIDADVLKDELRAKVLFIEDRAYREKIRGRQRLSDNLYSVVSGIFQSITTVNLQPTIEECKTGRWEYNESIAFLYHKCSECGYTNWGTGTHFCPNCGAKMVTKKGAVDRETN